jgi:hypothetical protein
VTVIFRACLAAAGLLIAAGAAAGQGTSWEPAGTAMHAHASPAGSWEVGAHWSAFVQRLAERGPRGASQFGSVNWMMVTGQRRTAGGRIVLRGMFSLDNWTIAGCGYPNLLASGELCDDEPIYDLQHPHELFMEVAARYDRPLGRRLALQLYAGIAGEPALGPVAYPHRTSASANPISPISHHWLDATHISFGVVTAGLYGNRWKAEASLFNGREPDASRHDIEWGALDSWSGRLWWAPSPGIVMQVSAAHLEDAEAQSLHDGGARFDVERMTASTTYHRRSSDGNVWATTIAWGRNEEVLGRTDALLVESTFALGDRDVWFGRHERNAKPSYDLGIFAPGSCASAHCPPSMTSCCSLPVATTPQPIYIVSKTQAGYMRYVHLWWRLKTGLGAVASLSRVPRDLEPTYGSRHVAGAAVFLKLGPGASQHGDPVYHR